MNRVLWVISPSVEEGTQRKIQPRSSVPKPDVAKPDVAKHDAGSKVQLGSGNVRDLADDREDGSMDWNQRMARERQEQDKKRSKMGRKGLKRAKPGLIIISRRGGGP